MRFCSWGRLLGSLFPWRPDMAAPSRPLQPHHQPATRELPAARRHLGPPPAPTSAAEGQTSASSPSSPQRPPAARWQLLSPASQEGSGRRSGPWPARLPSCGQGQTHWTQLPPLQPSEGFDPRLHQVPPAWGPCAHRSWSTYPNAVGRRQLLDTECCQLYSSAAKELDPALDSYIAHERCHQYPLLTSCQDLSMQSKEHHQRWSSTPELSNNAVPWLTQP